jgi:hypothetical protein
MIEAQVTLTERPSADSFDWPLAAEAERLLRRILDQFFAESSFARLLSERTLNETATDFFEWIDHFSLGFEHEDSLAAVGFVRETGDDAPEGERVLAHPRATLPRVRLRRGTPRNALRIALRPESVVDFVAGHHLRSEIVGEPFSRYRAVIVAQEGGASLEAVERHAYRGFVGAGLNPADLEAIIKARELWRTRPRRLADEAEGFMVATQILKRVVALVGQDRACQYFFEEERRYWQSRNHAARVQKHRQDQLGLGWGNHDHHTFRSSRRHFVDLIQFLLQLGFHKRERFYAGAEAGWGAQILENPVTGIVVFADVDLLPDEVAIDFSSVKIPATPRLGTVGLWVGLHGESFLQAGMHHLEARFDFDLLQTQLKASGVKTMAPFSDFQFLRQAFTEGERWPVAQERLEALFAAKQITREQLEQFRAEGAIGSHLENLQRHGGFKGFNQKSVSVIIQATDPRREHFRGS